MSVVGTLNRNGWAEIFAAAVVCLVMPGSAMLGGAVRAATAVEERKLPMTFTWHEAAPACAQDCAGWIGAVGIINAETPDRFEKFASGRELKGATVILDSSGGSVLDAIALGRRWRGLGLRTAVGTVVEKEAAGGLSRDVTPDAYCESMCVFLLLSGNSRTVPDGARVRVHQIWMGDRADDAKAASYSADDMMIVERDIGRLAKYTFDMGGSGDLLSLALSVPPWEPLHQLSAEELRQTNLVTADAVADSWKPSDAVVGSVAPKVFQDRVASETVLEKSPRLTPGTRTAEVAAPTGGAAAVSDRK